MKPENVTLVIDTTAIRVVTVRLEAGGKTLGEKTVLEHGNTQALLPLIDDLLKRNDLSLRCVTGITVATGPGSYTGLRVGIAVANALSVFLGIPVNGSRSLATPLYS